MGSPRRTTGRLEWAGVDGAGLVAWEGLGIRYWVWSCKNSRIAISDSQAACINFLTSVIHARDVGRSTFQ